MVESHFKKVKNMEKREQYYNRILNKRVEKSPAVIEWADAYPYCDLLMAEESTDGTPRKGMSIMFYMKDGKMLCRLHDPEVDLKAWLPVQDPLRAFEEVEKALDSSTLDWTHFVAKPGRNGRA